MGLFLGSLLCFIYLISYSSAIVSFILLENTCLLHTLFLLLSFKSPYIILENNPLSDVPFENIVFQSVACLLILWMICSFLYSQARPYTTNSQQTLFSIE